MIGQWVPVSRRSHIVAMIVSTASLSTVFALPMTSWLVRTYGWPVPFYAFGLVGIVWAVAWFTQVDRGRGVAGETDAPAEARAGTGVRAGAQMGQRGDARVAAHARAGANVGEAAQARMAGESRAAIPWGRLLRLPPVWAIIITNFSFNWSFFVLSAWLPSYLKSTFGLSLVNGGVLSAAPFLTSFIMANLAGYTADRLLRAGRSTTFVRKLMQGVGLGLGGLFLLQLPAAGSVTVAVVLMCLAMGSLALCFAGYAPNCFDVAPRYAEVIWAMANTVGTLPGIFGVFITGWLVDRTGSFGVPLQVTAGVSLFGALVYLAFGSGQRQIE
jgi:ACS family sodium-dependent inorganic phosphate cotransporter